MASNKNIENIALQEKKERGQALYKDILNKVHKGNFEDMYLYISRRVERLNCYGDTKEQQVINYCTYKRDSVLYIYK